MKEALNDILIVRGVFSLSKEAVWWLRDHGWEGRVFSGTPEIARHDPLLLQCFRELGEDALGTFTEEARIVQISGNRYRIIKDTGYFEKVETPDNADWVVIE